MTKARRRDAWGRMAELLALVDARTAWSEDIKPKPPAAWIPAALRLDTEQRGLTRPTTKVVLTVADLREMMNVRGQT